MRRPLAKSVVALSLALAGAFLLPTNGKSDLMSWGGGCCGTSYTAGYVPGYYSGYTGYYPDYNWGSYYGNWGSYYGGWGAGYYGTYYPMTFGGGFYGSGCCGGCSSGGCSSGCGSCGLGSCCGSSLACAGGCGTGCCGSGSCSGGLACSGDCGCGAAQWKRLQRSGGKTAGGQETSARVGRRLCSASSSDYDEPPARARRRAGSPARRASRTQWSGKRRRTRSERQRRTAHWRAPAAPGFKRGQGADTTPPKANTPPAGGTTPGNQETFKPVTPSTPTTPPAKKRRHRRFPLPARSTAIPKCPWRRNRTMRWLRPISRSLVFRNGRHGATRARRVRSSVASQVGRPPRRSA